MERALVAYLTGEQLPPMPPATRSLGIAALIVAIVALGIDLFELARLSLWRSKAPWLPAFQRLFHLVAPWLPVLIFVLLPTLLKGVFDRAVNYGVLFRLAPGVVGWLVGSALLGVALGVGRLALWLRLGSRGRD
jgi:hypothetical protein